MAWSKSTRICMMIVLDTIFLFLELGVGYWAKSLALIADAFHMLNDIISLAVGLWAVSLAKKETTDKFSYGWLRAEILGAFFNATFLIGLCLTIILEALQRFIEPPEIKDPQIILIVGSVGLASNLLGFWILGGHGHSHGGHGDEEHDENGGHSHVHTHDHAHGGHVHGDISCAEEGHADVPSAVDEDAPIRDLLPEAVIARNNARHITFDQNGASAAEAGDARNEATLGRAGSRASNSSGGRGRERRRAGSMRHNRLTSIDDIRIHPSSFRQDLLETISGNRRSFDQDDYESNPDVDTVPEEAVRESEDGSEPTEQTPLVKHDEAHSTARNNTGDNHKHGLAYRARRGSSTHVSHHHSKPKQKGGHGGHGHSHGDMGMNAMVLHVLGDALGNIGVIVTALIIWKTTWEYRFYADPAVSLLITLIILRSAIPLTKATSKILLQAVPDHIDLREIREDIQDLPGVISCHHIHVWQLSDTKLVASMHIEVAFPIAEGGGEKYMALQKRARKCLHAYGIHSATIQPEFRVNKLLPYLQRSAGASGPDEYDCSRRNNKNGGNSSAAMGTGLDGTVADSLMDRLRDDDTCLLECVEDCVGKGCCSSRTATPPGSSHSAPTSVGDHEDHH